MEIQACLQQRVVTLPLELVPRSTLLQTGVVQY
jgi:hypothetical protein